MNTIGETINSCNDDVKNTLKKLFDLFRTLENILEHKEASELYCRLMIHVIAKREVELGHAKYNYNNWRMEYRSWEEIRKDYGGTIVMPY